jgi:hypothetical protein
MPHELDIGTRLTDSGLSDVELRAFGIACCTRLPLTFDEPLLPKLIDFAAKRNRQSVTSEELKSTRDLATARYDALYSGAGSPPSIAIALSSIGSVAFTEGSLKAAMQAATFAAQAMATHAVENAAAGIDTDALWDEKYRQELQAQGQILSDLLKHRG